MFAPNQLPDIYRQKHLSAAITVQICHYAAALLITELADSLTQSKWEIELSNSILLSQNVLVTGSPCLAK